MLKVFNLTRLLEKIISSGFVVTGTGINLSPSIDTINVSFVSPKKKYHYISELVNMGFVKLRKSSEYLESADNAFVLEVTEKGRDYYWNSLLSKSDRIFTCVWGVISLVIGFVLGLIVELK